VMINAVWANTKIFWAFFSNCTFRNLSPEAPPGPPANPPRRRQVRPGWCYHTVMHQGRSRPHIIIAPARSCGQVAGDVGSFWLPYPPRKATHAAPTRDFRRRLEPYQRSFAWSPWPNGLDR